MTTDDLRSIPSVESLLNHPDISAVAEHGRDLCVYGVRRAVARAKDLVKAGKETPDPASIAADARRVIDGIVAPSLRPVINATGVIVHTNLGRAPLGRSVLDDIAPIVTGYCNVEYDLRASRRGHRVDHVREILRYLTGAEDVVVVNNNAAAVILTLHTLARHKEVPVSRGELIEIGGAFRIPDIMAASGAKMVEVGTTNRTRLSDYEKAIGEKTALLFKAHRSNYSIKGFTEEVSTRDLARLARSRGIPSVYDIGSGLLRKVGHPELDKEPDVRSAIDDGADLVLFSCDKLLGGPQAGIVAGRAELVARLAKAPLMRALRVGKLTLAALWSVCRGLLNETRSREVNPTRRMFMQSYDRIHSRAMKLAALLQARGVACSVAESQGQVGGGSLPDATLRSAAVELTPPGTTTKQHEAFAERIYFGLQRTPQPVLGILREGRVVFDVMTLLDEELPVVAGAVAEIAAPRAGE